MYGSISVSSRWHAHRAKRWCIAATENPIKWWAHSLFYLEISIAEKCHRLVRVGADKWKSIVVVNMGQVMTAATNQRPWSVWTTEKCVYREKSRIDLWWIEEWLLWTRLRSRSRSRAKSNDKQKRKTIFSDFRMRRNISDFTVVTHGINLSFTLTSSPKAQCHCRLCEKDAFYADYLIFVNCDGHVSVNVECRLANAWNVSKGNNEKSCFSSPFRCVITEFDLFSISMRSAFFLSIYPKTENSKCID